MKRSQSFLNLFPIFTEQFLGSLYLNPQHRHTDTPTQAHTRTHGLQAVMNAGGISSHLFCFSSLPLTVSSFRTSHKNISGDEEAGRGLGCFQEPRYPPTAPESSTFYLIPSYDKIPKLKQFILKII